MAGARNGARGHETASWGSRPATCATGRGPAARSARQPAPGWSRLDRQSEAPAPVCKAQCSTASRGCVRSSRCGGRTPAGEPGMTPAPREVRQASRPPGAPQGGRGVTDRLRRNSRLRGESRRDRRPGVPSGLDLPAAEIRVAQHDRNGSTLDWPSSPDSPSEPAPGDDLWHERGIRTEHHPGAFRRNSQTAADADHQGETIHQFDASGALSPAGLSTWPNTATQGGPE